MYKDKEVIERIQNSGLSRVSDKLIELTSNRVRMNAIPEDEGLIPIGYSRIGGKPDLPTGCSWPRSNDTYLTFIAQINLDHISKLQDILPQNGLLSFFYDAVNQPWGFDPNDRGKWKVIYTSATQELERKEEPDNLNADGSFGTCKVSFSTQTTIPSWESRFVDRLKLNERESDLYCELLDELYEYNDCSRTIHSILGHPDQIQGEMQLECQLVTHGLSFGDSSVFENPLKEALDSGADSWKLLLQIDSEEDINMSWGDAGRLYFWIHDDDLKANNYENVWLILQCT